MMMSTSTSRIYISVWNKTNNYHKVRLELFHERYFFGAFLMFLVDFIQSCTAFDHIWLPQLHTIFTITTQEYSRFKAKSTHSGSLSFRVSNFLILVHPCKSILLTAAEWCKWHDFLVLHRFSTSPTWTMNQDFPAMPLVPEMCKIWWSISFSLAFLFILFLSSASVAGIWYRVHSNGSWFLSAEVVLPNEVWWSVLECRALHSSRVFVDFSCLICILFPLPLIFFGQCPVLIFL